MSSLEGMLWYHTSLLTWKKKKEVGKDKNGIPKGLFGEKGIKKILINKIYRAF